MKSCMKKILATTAFMAMSSATIAHQGTAEGVVRKLDAEAGRVIVKHGNFKGIHMPGMTMAFKVRDRSILGGVNVQDAVRITVEHEGPDYFITRIERLDSPIARQDQP